jgi:RNA ligase
MLETLNKYYEDGWLIKQTHPTLPLTIWNYSQTTQYDSKWDEITLQCRGLITDNNTGKAIVRPFKKFFNYEELVGGKWKESQIPAEGDYVYVQEKMDGSLGILFNYKGEWVMATRGSFTSDQAIKGMEIVKSKYNLASWMPEYAYLVEIIYPENRIVVNYKKEKVVFLSAVLNETYKWKPTDDTELHWTTANTIFKSNGIKKSDIVKTEQHFNFSDELYKSLKEKNEANKEGYVLRYQPGNFRMKIKFEEYVRLHRIMTNLSTTAVWEVVSTGGKMEDLLKDVPDEFYKKIKAYELELRYGWYQYYNYCGKLHDYFRYGKYNDIEVEPTKREFVEHIKDKHPKVKSILFAMWDGKDYSKIIWNILKPEFEKL